MIKLNKEYPLEILGDKMDVKYGSVNRKHPSVVYAIAKFWMSCSDKKKISKEISDMVDESKKRLFEKLKYDDVFSTSFIVDCDGKFDCFSGKNKVYGEFSFFFRQKTNQLVPLENMGEKVKNIIEGELISYVKSVESLGISIKSTKS